MRVRLFAGIATAIVSVFGCFLCVPKDLMFHFRFSNVTFEIISRLAYNICLYLTIKKNILKIILLLINESSRNFIIQSLKNIVIQHI